MTPLLKFQEMLPLLNRYGIWIKQSRNQIQQLEVFLQYKTGTLTTILGVGLLNRSEDLSIISLISRSSYWEEPAITKRDHTCQ
jgi:hypothetical protein